MPGTEEQVCRELSVQFSRSQHSIYYALSEFDIVLLVALDSLGELDPPILYTHPKIWDYQQVVCYSHADDRWKFPDAPALTITMLKFDDSEVTEHGIGIDEAARELVGGGSVKVAARRQNELLLGTLGWPEAIFVQHGSNMRTLLSRVAGLVARGREIGNLQVSHTIPCVRRKASSATPGRMEFEAVEGTTDDWRIAISCHPHLAYGLRRDLDRMTRTEAGEPRLTMFASFGRRDLIVQSHAELEHRISEINGILSIVSALGNELSGQVLATHTDLGMHIADSDLAAENGSVSAPRDRYLGRQELLGLDLEALQQQIDAFEIWEHDRHNLTLRQTSQLRQMVLRLQAISATPGLESIVNDMFPFVEAAVGKACSQVGHIAPVIITQGIRSTYGQLEDMENVYLFGLDQRMAGARLGLGHASQAYSNLQGLGIPRILRASSAIPLGLISGISPDIGDNWRGFTVFGFRNDTFTMPGEVINLPHQDMLHPEDWWRLGHESGHAFGMITDLLDNPILGGTIDQLDKSMLARVTGLGVPAIVDELAVSVFEYVFCYRGNFDLYLTTTWRFFDSLLEGSGEIRRLEEYLLRTIFVFFFHLQTRGALRPRERVSDVLSQGKKRRTLFDGDIARGLKERAFADQLSLEGIIAHSIVDMIDKVVAKTRHTLRQVDLRELAAAYINLETLRTDLFDLFDSFVDRAGHPKGIDNFIADDLPATLAKIGNQLHNGEIIDVANRPVDAFLIPLALQESKARNGDESVTQTARLAAILSLWHADRAWHRIPPSEDTV